MSSPNQTISFEQYQQISQEIAVLDKFGSIAAKVKDRVLGFMNSARSFIGSSKTFKEDVDSKIAQEVITQSLAIKYLHTIPYTTARDLAVYIPPAFVGNMSDYLDHLLDGLKYYNDFEKTVLDPAIAYISRAITTPSALGGPTAPKISTDWADKWAEQEASYFGQNIASNVTNFGNIYSSNTQFQDSYAKVLVLQKFGKTINLRSIRTKVKQLVELFDKLMMKMMASPDIYKVNGLNAQSLSDLSYALARGVELCSVFTNNANIAVVAYVQTEDKFAEIYTAKK